MPRPTGGQQRQQPAGGQRAAGPQQAQGGNQAQQMQAELSQMEHEELVQLAMQLIMRLQEVEGQGQQQQAPQQRQQQSPAGGQTPRR